MNNTKSFHTYSPAPHSIHHWIIKQSHEKLPYLEVIFPLKPPVLYLISASPMFACVAQSSCWMLSSGSRGKSLAPSTWNRNPSAHGLRNISKHYNDVIPSGKLLEFANLKPSPSWPIVKPVDLPMNFGDASVFQVKDSDEAAELICQGQAAASFKILFKSSRSAVSIVGHGGTMRDVYVFEEKNIWRLAWLRFLEIL